MLIFQMMLSKQQVFNDCSKEKNQFKEICIKAKVKFEIQRKVRKKFSK